MGGSLSPGAPVFVELNGHGVPDRLSHPPPRIYSFLVEDRSLVPRGLAGSTLLLLQPAFQCPLVLVSAARGPEVMTVPKEPAYDA